MSFFQQIIMLVLFALLIGNLFGFMKQPEEIIIDVEEAYIGGLKDNQFRDNPAYQLVLKGVFMIIAGFAIITTSVLGGLDVSPIIYTILAFLLLPIAHIVALILVSFEFIIKRLFTKPVQEYV